MQFVLLDIRTQTAWTWILECVVFCKDALNFVKICCAVNPQVRVLLGYRNHRIRLGNR